MPADPEPIDTQQVIENTCVVGDSCANNMIHSGYPAYLIYKLPGKTSSYAISMPWLPMPARLLQQIALKKVVGQRRSFQSTEFMDAYRLSQTDPEQLEAQCVLWSLEACPSHDRVPT